MRHKKIILSALIVLLSAIAFSQTQFSIGTDVTLLRSFKKNQQFFAAGQTIHVQFHFVPKDGAYISYGYSSEGSFKKDFVATAKLPVTTPQAVDFKIYSKMSFRNFSIGWKHYLKGAYNAEDSWNLYFTAGFGLVAGKIKNRYTIGIDTAQYNYPGPANGNGNFKRLTFDAALGYEVPIGMAIYLYGEARAWIPASDYPSKYLFVNEKAPLIGTASIGLRIWFD